MLSIFNTKHIGWEDNNTTSVNYYELFLDSEADLPDDLYYFSTETTKYKMMQGSLAYDIATGTMYMLQSDGTWIEQ